MCYIERVLRQYDNKDNVFYLCYIVVHKRVMCDDYGCLMLAIVAESDGISTDINKTPLS